MPSIILIVLTLVLAVCGIVFPMKNENSKLTKYAWLTIALLIVLNMIQVYDSYRKDKEEIENDLASKAEKQQRHKEILNSQLVAYQPLEFQRFYLEFELDSTNIELRRYLKKARRAIERKYGFSSREPVNFGPIDYLTPSESEFPMVHLLTQGTFFGCDLISGDSAKLSLQLGYNIPTETFDVEFHIEKHRWVISYQERRPAFIGCDSNFANLLQVSSAEFDLSPRIFPAPFKQIISFKIVSKNGVVIVGKKFREERLTFNKNAVSYLGQLQERRI